MRELSPLYDLTKIIHARRKKALLFNETNRLLMEILKMTILVILSVSLFFGFFQIKRVEGDAMFPAFYDGDLVLVYKAGKYKKEDVVFYRKNNRQWMGRIVAKGGDSISITEDGTLIVNGSVQSGQIVYPTYPPKDWKGPITVKKGEVFLLGDHRIETMDSRAFGSIPERDITGVAVLIIRHRGI